MICLAAAKEYKQRYHHPWHSDVSVIHAALLADLAGCNAAQP